MKKTALSLALMAPFALQNAIADSDIDMSNPTDVYTSIGASYGSDGMNIKTQLMLSESTGESGSKTGIIFEAKNVFNEHADTAKFSGGYDVSAGKPVPKMNDTRSERSYRLRYGTINTTNGTGWSIDSVLFDHPFYGQSGVIQAGPVMTLPITDNFYIFPILYVGGVVTENNDAMVRKGTPAEDIPSSDSIGSNGVDIASLVATGMIYARYSFNDNWWTLLSASYTDDFQGKSWHADVADGGLQLASFQSELSVAYQINNRQNIRVNYKTDNSDDTDDSYWIEYNHAF